MQVRFPLLAIAASLVSACIVQLPSGQLPLSRDDRQPVFTQGTAGRNPIIQSFTANPSNVTKGQAITFQVVATDAEGSPLQLNWAATDGTLSTTTGHVVSWLPPEKPGVYSVTVTVANGRGGFVTGTQNLTVQADGAAVIGGTPASPPVTALSPAALPSVQPSPVPSASPTPTVSPTPASPMPSSSIVPSPSASPSPTASPFVQLNYTSQEARLSIPAQERMAGAAEFIRFKAVSASGTQYRVMLSEIMPVPVGHFINIDVASDGTGVSKWIYRGVYAMYFIRTDHYEEDSAGSIGKVRLKDGVGGHLGLPFRPAAMDRANLQIPTGVWPVMDHLNGGMFVFKYDAGELDLGTFNLP